MRLRGSKLCKTILLFVVLLILISPLFIMVSTSLKTYSQVTLWPPQLVGFEPQWGNYIEVISGKSSILTQLTNSFIVSSISALLCVVCGTLAAYAVSRFSFKGKNLFLIIILATQMFSSVILVNPLYVIFRDLGLLNTRLALIIANTSISLPMAVWLLYSYISSIPFELEEAALLDGCSRMAAVLHVIAPLMVPGIITAALFTFIMCWGDLIFARTFILDSNLQTASVALTNFRSLYSTSWHTQMAAGVITTLPVFLIFLGIQKYLVKNMMGAGLKG